MSEDRTIISSATNPDFRLRSIESGDIEDLRGWKNLNKGSFFLKEDITPEQQRVWFNHFCHRAADRMFVVEQRTDDGWEKIGCMGFRLLHEECCVDAYNIIRSRKIEPASFNMSDPFRTMLAYAGRLHDNLPIRCKVLTDNPAVSWYERNGFSMVEQLEGFVLMELDKNTIENLELNINSHL